MASAVSYEYLTSIRGATGGVATLGSDSKVPVSQLPSSMVSVFKGTFATIVALNTAHTSGAIGNYAYVVEISGFMYWNDELSLWVAQEIEESDYLSLSDDEKACVPYLVVPDAPAP